MKYQYIIIALLGVMLSILVESAGIFQFIEMQALDTRYELRSQIFRTQEQSEQIVIIGIDDASIAQIKEPFILWDTFFAEIIEKLAEHQAKIIGLDFIWAKQIDDFVTRSNKDRNALRRALLKAKNKYHSKIVIGVGATTRQKTGSEILETDTSLQMKKFGFFLKRNDFGVVNTLPDSDNYIRRVKPLYQSDTADGKNLPSFSNLIATYYNNTEPLNALEPLIINYQLNKHFQVLPFKEVLDKARANDSQYFIQNFKDKIVLIGMTNVSGDILPSPLGQETPGVMIHAHAIDMLVNNELLYKTSIGLLFALNLFLAFLVVYYSSKNSLKSAVLLTLLLLLLYTGTNLLLFNANIFLPFIAPVLLILWSFSVTYLYRFVSEERSKRRLAKFFGSYVNDQVVKDILNSDKPPAMEGKREKICILFSDIRGFTTYSEKLPPEEVVKALNEYFSAMTDVILENNGTVDKFIGDGLMAFFGAPLHIDNPTLSAVKSAIEMRQRLEELNKKWQSEGRAQLDNGIGLHTGYALVGNIGSYKKIDYTAIGDSVNTASRVEGVTKTVGAPILMTQAAREEVEDEVICEAKGEVPLKGRSGIFVFEVKKMKDDRK